MSFKYPLATSSWDQEEQDALQRVIKSDRFSMGAEVAAFEKQFAAWAGTKYAVMVSSGSAANLAMVTALRYTKNTDLQLMPGDEVLVPAVSWSTTYYPLHQYGLKLRFVDIDPETLNFDLDKLADAVTPNTRGIMAVNLLGNPNDFAAIKALTDKHNLVLLEDNCESMGATFNGQQAGTFGTMGSFSTFFSHHISTMEGGMVVVDDEEIYHILLSIRAHGWTRNLPKENLVSGTKSDDPFEESFKFVLPGYNIRPLDMSGALGQAQLKKLPGLIEGRRVNGAHFQNVMADHPLFSIQREVGESSWFGFSLVLRDGIDMTRKDVVARLGEEGFECRPIVTGNFTRNPVIKYFDYTTHDNLPVADRIHDHGLFVGNHHYPIKDAVDFLGQFK